jgi:hypothetical protein
MGVLIGKLSAAPDDEDEILLRRLVYPEEDRYLHTTLPWTGGYRWFRSENVVCIEHYRRSESLPQCKAS